MSRLGARRQVSSLLPRRTIRLRLTLLFGALFLVAGAALLAFTYVLVDHRFTANGANFFVTAARSSGGSGKSVSILVGGSGGASPQGPSLPFAPTPAQIEKVARLQSSAAVHELLVDSALALALMALVSIWLGWVVAGRVLSPLRTITAAAKDISATNLDRRLALRGPDDELTQLGNTFDDLLGRLESAFEAQRQFVANASHELRTPLTLERALVEVALADPDPSVSSLRETCQQVLAAGEHQERLIEALLTLSRSQRGLDRHEPVDLMATAAEALTETPHGHVTIASDLAPAWTSGDERLVGRLVGNLLANAIRHNVPDGRVKLRTSTRAAQAVLSVENSGPLVPRTELGRLFEPFQRLEHERRYGGDGLGLGLSIVEAIARAHGATLQVRANPTGGLCIEVAFPAVEPPAASVAPRDAAPVIAVDVGREAETPIALGTR